jgi:signal transduction histidine kinase
MTTEPSLLRQVIDAGPFTRRTWREQNYLVATAFVAAMTFGAVFLTVLPGSVTALLIVTLPFLALLVVFELRVARRFATGQRRLVAWAFDERVIAPPRFRRRRPGLWGWLWSSLTDWDGWRALAYQVLTFPLKAFALWATAAGWILGAMWATYPLWWSAFGPVQKDSAGHRHHAGLVLGDWFADSWPKALLVMAAGLVVLWATPWVVRALSLADRPAVRWLLSPRPADRRLAEMEEQRAHAVAGSAAALRRIERDLHDGTQAQLVAVAMQLDMAREQLAEGDADGARARLDAAHRQATDAIADLREVTRSIHPPALDVGLDTALTTLAARSAVPIVLRTAVTRRPSPAVETIAYFCVAELLTNVARHSGARTGTVEATEQDGRLVLRVGDDGHGGAVLRTGGGLAGLADRVSTVDGHLAVDSPVGGPTTVTIDLPMWA